MTNSKIFKGNIQISKLLKDLNVGQAVILEIEDGYSINDGMKAITASSPVRKKLAGELKLKKEQLKIDVKLSAMTAISGNQMDVL